jgi:hypothetical protein
MSRVQSMVAGLLCAMCMVVHAQAGFTGKWEGATASGRPLLLDLKVTGEQMTGTLTLGPQSAEIAEGKADAKVFSFKATIDGRTNAITGRLVGEDIELTVPGVSSPPMLKRAK